MHLDIYEVKLSLVQGYSSEASTENPTHSFNELDCKSNLPNIKIRQVLAILNIISSSVLRYIVKTEVTTMENLSVRLAF